MRHQLEGLVDDAHIFAAPDGQFILIEIADDGKGLNRQRIFETAVKRGLIDAEAQLSDAEIEARLVRFIDEELLSPGTTVGRQDDLLSGEMDRRVTRFEGELEGAEE